MIRARLHAFSHLERFLRSDTAKERDWAREKQRAMRAHNRNA